MEGNDLPIHTVGTAPMDMLWNTSSSSAFITCKQPWALCAPNVRYTSSLMLHDRNGALTYPRKGRLAGWPLSFLLATVDATIYRRNKKAGFKRQPWYCLNIQALCAPAAPLEL